MIGWDCPLPAAAIGGVSVEDGVAVPQETTETRQLKRPFTLEPVDRACLFVLLFGPISVFERPHFFVQCDVEVVIEVATEGRIPWERPAPSRFVSLDLVQRRACHHRHRRVSAMQVPEATFRGLITQRRAAWARLIPCRTEHEVIDDQLLAALEQVDEPHLTLLALEDVILLDLDHRKLSAFFA